MQGSIQRYCSCKNPTTGRAYGKSCPDLKKDKHGQWDYRERIDSSAGVRELRRRGFQTRKAAQKFREEVEDLLKLAKGDPEISKRLGDLVFEKTKRGGQLPDVDDVRRRLGIGRALDRSMRLGEWLEQWYAGKKRARRDSHVDTIRGHLDHYLIPFLGHLPIDQGHRTAHHRHVRPDRRAQRRDPSRQSRAPQAGAAR